ncbi:sestrin-2 [Reticulomyxa filosa]|uniref:Sestrin-2 n=1 Tax=Reticulomyxa filosa TaxID=46433 RepID=X6NZA1_RETFI|nr:sestrin-2 [Reticulomyxa filosa]|eukprot:ETO31169.1 sestrin-2 [Reticulomyxa filosa]
MYSVTNLDLLLSKYPSYWADFSNFNATLMLGNGPILQEWRYYLAIMAASRYDCEPLIGFLECKFQEHHGNPAWLIGGLDASDRKLKKITQLNALLAHQPWAISPDHIAVLFYLLL